MKEIINDRVILIIGLPGSGKTTLLTSLVMIPSKKVKIYANYVLKIANYVPFNVEDLEKLNLSEDIKIIALDEAYTLLESRKSMDDLNLYLSYKAFQSRKIKSRYILTAQVGSSVDVRFRELAGIIIKAKHVVEGYYYEVFHNVEKNGRRVLKKKKSWLISHKKASYIYPFFNTREIVMTDRVKDTIIKNMSRKTVNVLAKKLAKKMLKLKPKWSMRQVKSYLFDNDQSKEYAEPIYYAIETIKLNEELKNNKKNKKKKKERVVK